MAPRCHSETIFEYPLEFKPRLDLWSSPSCNNSWSQPTHHQRAQQGRRRAVNFARSTKEIEHIHVSDYTTEEIQACWYKRSDYKRIRASNQATIHHMCNQLPPLLSQDDEHHTHVGLETRATPRDNFLCHQAIRLAINAVLDEQEDQLRYDGCYNPEILAARYSAYTSSCIDQARYIGTRQAEDATFCPTTTV
jgi:hypothetical protein